MDRNRNKPYIQRTDLISPRAKFFVTWANEHGIMTGITEEEFNPQGQYTVEQAVATIVRLYNCYHRF